MNSMYLLAQTGGDAVSNWPVFVLLISVAFIIVTITVLRLHAFIALIGAALLAAWLSADSMDAFVNAPSLVTEGFGNTAKGVAVVIALAALIGMCLMDSGAADRIVRKFLKVFGEKRAGWALMCSGFVLSIPVFFDTVFFLLAPIARMLGLRTGKNFMFYVMVIGAGGAITHSIVPPTPGPLLVGDMLGLQLGVVIIAGLIGGIIPAIVSVRFARFLDKKTPVPVRETAGSTLDDLKKAVDRPDSELPSFWLSILPVVAPALLLAVASFVDMFEKQGIKEDVVAAMEAEWAPAEFETAVNTSLVSQLTRDAMAEHEGLAESLTMLLDERALGDVLNGPTSAEAAIIYAAVSKASIKAAQEDSSRYSKLHAYTAFLGDKIIALGLGALIAMIILMRQTDMSMQGLSDKCVGPLETAGLIILITCAGGAFGSVIRETGIGDVIKHYGENGGVNFIILAWAVTAFVRIAQGSATVSMITGAGLMAAVIGDGSALDYHPLYIFLAVGFGSITCSWMNDSGFWIVGRLSGFTERETLRTWTPMLTLIAVVGLIETLVVSMIFPFK